MSAAPKHFKQASAPLRGSAVAAGASVEGFMSAAPNRFKQASAPLGGSAAAAGASVGAF